MKMMNYQTLTIGMKWTQKLNKFLILGNHVYNLLLNQDHKRLTQIQLSRRKQRAFIAFDKGSEIILKIGSTTKRYEEHVSLCYNFIKRFRILFPEQTELSEKLERQLYYQKKAIKSFEPLI